MKETWRGVVDHIDDEHQWVAGCCSHTDLTERDSSGKQPLSKSSRAWKVARDLLLAPKLLKSFKYYVNGRYVEFTGRLLSLPIGQVLLLVF